MRWQEKLLRWVVVTEGLAMAATAFMWCLGQTAPMGQAATWIGTRNVTHVFVWGLSAAVFAVHDQVEGPR